MVQYTTKVNASLEKVWQYLIYKIDHPEHFVPGVSEVMIMEKTAEFVSRQMTVTTPETVTILKEKITFVPYKVRFLLVDHPKLEGYVDNDIEKISDTETQMTFTIDWVDKTTQEPINNFEMVQNAVLKTKTFIESKV
ncbi:MAG: AtaL-like protein [Flavobacterium sp.]